MIEIQNLTKRYGDLTAVDDLSCTIEKGRIYGLLGVNGAGKTTTMNMITGALAPTSGRIVICGSDLATDPISAKRHIGYLPENPPLYPDFTVREYLTFVAEAKSVPQNQRASAIAGVIEQTGLSGVADRLIRNLSKGYCQRIGIAQAVLGDPDILILDEPTVGLDPRQIVEIRTLIRSLAKNHTVILSSHILTEVAELCDTLLILSCGKLVAVGSLPDLQKQYLGNDQLHFTVKCTAKKCEEVLRPIKGILKSSVTSKDSVSDVQIECAKGSDLREAVFFAFAAIRCPIIEMHLREASLEDVFLSATTHPTASETGKSALPLRPVGRREKQPVRKGAGDRDKPKTAPQPSKSEPQTEKTDEDDDDYTPLFGRKEKRP